MSVQAVFVCVVGFALGILTVFAQGWLPQELGSLANSSGSWALIAFLLALFATTRGSAAVFGCLALVTLLLGYVIGGEARDIASSTALITFWGLAAVIAGPILGLCAHWTKAEGRYLAAVGAGVMCGVLIGEGVYGLSYIADTTSSPYWWGEMAIGVVLLGYVAARRLRELKLTAAAVACSLVVAAAFVGIYSRDLIALFP